MSMTDDVKRAHEAIKNPEMRKQIMDKAKAEGISFNAAMKDFFKKKA